eukprot:3706416-Amphidinium_carterae.1
MYCLLSDFDLVAKPQSKPKLNTEIVESLGVQAAHCERHPCLSLPVLTLEAFHCMAPHQQGYKNNGLDYATQKPQLKWAR